MIRNTADKAHAKKLQAIFRLLKNYKKEKYKMLWKLSGQNFNAI